MSIFLSQRTRKKGGKMSDLHDFLAKLVFNQDFRADFHEAVQQNNIENFVRTQGYISWNQEQIDNLRRINVNELSEIKVKELPEGLLNRVGLDPRW